MSQNSRGEPLSSKLRKQIIALSDCQGGSPLTSREIAAKAGVSATTVSRIWREEGITPPTLRVELSAKEAPATDRAIRLEDVAERAAVSVSTVSLALKNSPEISEATRSHVVKLAKELGYTPHPYLSAMMSRIRSGRYRKMKATLGWIQGGTRPLRKTLTEPYGTSRRFKAACEHASSLGYHLDPFWLNDPDTSPERLCQILRNRGIRGVILNISAGEAKRIKDSMEDFAVVGFNLTDAPNCHHIQEDGYRDVLRLCVELWRCGYRRIGVSVPDSVDEDTLYQPTAAHTFFESQTLPPKDRIPHLFWAPAPKDLTRLLQCQSPSDLLMSHQWMTTVKWADYLPSKTGSSADFTMETAIICAWLEHFRPDALITNPMVFPALSRLNWKVPDQLGLVHRNLNADVPDWSGIRRNEEAIGSAAVELLAGCGSVENGEANPIPARFYSEGNGLKAKQPLAEMLHTIICVKTNGLKTYPTHWPYVPYKTGALPTDPLTCSAKLFWPEPVDGSERPVGMYDRCSDPSRTQTGDAR